MRTDEKTGTPARAGRKEWLGLGVLLLPLLLVSMDVSVLYFAVPFISADLEPTSSQQLWIFDIYGFVLAGLLITMGAVGDRIGRRRLLMVGAAAFGAASVAAAYSDSAGMLIVIRGLLGVGGATLMPSTLALLRTMFADPRQRATAIAVWSATLTGGVALGPVLSGFLLSHFWWGSVFLINTPVMLMLLVAAPLLLPEYRTPRQGARPDRFDLLSSLLSLASVLPVIYGIKKLAADGFDIAWVAAIAVGLAIGALFVHRQRRPHAMLDLTLFARRAFSGSVVIAMLASFAMMGSAIFTTQYLQSVLGLSPLRAALWSVLPSVAVAGAAPLATSLARRVNRAYLLAGGLSIGAAGFGLLTQVQVDSRLWVVLVGAGVLAVGLVAVMTLVTDLIMASVSPAQAGAASSVSETGSEFGGALGMALLGSIGAAVYRRQVSGLLPAGLGPDAHAAAEQTLGGATAVAQQLPTQIGDQVVVAGRLAFTSGFHAAAAGGIGALVLGAVLAVMLLRLVGAPPDAPGTETVQPADGRVAPAAPVVRR